MKVYITKYALTRGIEEKEVIKTQFEGLVSVADRKYNETYHKPFWHQTKEEALQHAEELRTKKIASLKKQIKNLEGFKF